MTMVLLFFEIDGENLEMVTEGKDKLEERELFAPLITNFIEDELETDLHDITPEYERTKKVKVLENW